MDKDESVIPTILDWVNLPCNSEIQYLWHSLHDSIIENIKSDLLKRTIDITVDSHFIKDFNKLPSNERFILSFQDVSSARVSAFSIWPGRFIECESETREEESRRIKEYQEKGREESVNWNDFEKKINKRHPYNVSNAEMVTNSTLMSLKIDGSIKYRYFGFYIRAKSISIRFKSGELITLNEFLKFGENYWSNSAKRAINT
jgi:hypothetical protein